MNETNVIKVPDLNHSLKVIGCSVFSEKIIIRVIRNITVATM